MVIARKVPSKSGHRKVSFNMIRCRKASTRGLKNNLSLVEMLNVVRLIEFGTKDIPVVLEAYTKKELDYANRIIALSRNKRTRSRADRIKRHLYRKIVIENEKVSNPQEGKRLYRKLMREC